MIVRTVRLRNFRCHEEYVLNCQKKTSLIVGENGCGKTSVLEAMYVAMRGKSFRAVDGEILKRGEEFYRVEMEYENGEKTVVGYDGVRKQFTVGDKKYGRLPKKHKYPVVLFEPDDLNLVGASPSRRRDYFDRIFGQLDESYAEALNRYNKALKQRNELLKAEGVRAEALFSWNVLLARYGFEVRRQRELFCGVIDRRITDVYRTIAENKDEVGVMYEMRDGVGDESEYLRRLEAEFERDRMLGYTGFGVHRDNYEFMFNGGVADGSASRGEVRSVVLALKFIEAEEIFARIGKQPVVLLDDVFSELDETRQKCLVRNFKDNQVIITSVGVAE